MKDFKQALITLEAARAELHSATNTKLNLSSTNSLNIINNMSHAINLFKDCSAPTHSLFDSYLEVQDLIRNYTIELRNFIANLDESAIANTDQTFLTKESITFLPVYFIRYTARHKPAFDSFIQDVEDNHDFLAKTFKYTLDNEKSVVDFTGHLPTVKEFLITTLDVNFSNRCSYEIVPVTTLNPLPFFNKTSISKTTNPNTATTTPESTSRNEHKDENKGESNNTSLKL